MGLINLTNLVNSAGIYVLLIADFEIVGT